MILWTGVGIGFGCGVILASLVFLWLIVSASNRRNPNDERLIQFWEAIVEHQSLQLESLNNISAAVLSRKP